MRPTAGSGCGTRAPVDASAERDRLTIGCTEHGGGELEFVFQIAAPGIDAASFEHGCWRLPGLTVWLETNTNGPAVTTSGEIVELRYGVQNSEAGAPIHFVLRTEQQADPH